MDARPAIRTVSAQVDVFGANLSPCGEDCGPHIPEEDLTESVRLGLAKRFSGQITVSYHSLSDPATRQQYGSILETARSFGVPLPLVVIDGNIFQGGGIDFKSIVNALELKSEVAGIE